MPYDMELQRKESKEFLDDLTTRDQRMMFAVITIVHTADTKEALDNDTEAAVMEAINSFHGRKTMIIIAHRLNTIEKCDMIYRVENQKLVEIKNAD